MRITLLFGRICSGKSSYKPDLPRIVVSDVVRSIIGSADRSKLQTTMNLDDQIADRIVKAVAAFKKYKQSHRNVDIHISDEIIVDGIRQSSIVDQILQSYPDAKLVWLEVPVQERKRRYESRGADKDTEAFEIADNKPIELECQKIYTIFTKQLKVINN